MKILCVSDFVDPLIYNQRVKEMFPDIDLILCAGDLPMDYIDFIVTVFNKPTYFIFGNHNLKEFPLYHKNVAVIPHEHNTIRNNHNHGHGFVYAGFKCIKDYNLPIKNPKKEKKTPLLLVGASGCLKYNKGMAQYSDRQMKINLLKLVPRLFFNKIRYGRYLDIFLTHASPRHIHDHDDPCHKGFETFNWFIQKFKPTYMVHGHIHLYDSREERITKVDETTVVNAYSHCIIELQQD